MKFTELHPEFITGEDGVAQSYIAFDCPCGKMDSIDAPDRLVLPLRPAQQHGTARASWVLKDADFETFTLEPSVRRMDLCYFHFNVTNGVIVIHADNGKKPK